MTTAQFRAVKIGVVITLSIIVSVSVARGNAAIPVIAAAAAFVALLLAKSRVKGIIADERDYETAGKASLLAIQIYALITAMPMIVLYALRTRSPFFESVASALAYSLCFLLLVQAFAFRYYDRVQRLGKKHTATPCE